MEFKSSENMRNLTVQKSDITKLQFNKFIYTWTIENYTKLSSTVNHEIQSPTVVVHNDNDKYEFQILLNTLNYDANVTPKFCLDVQMLTYPIKHSQFYLLLSVLTSYGMDLNPLEKLIQAREGIKTPNNYVVLHYSITPSSIFDKCVSNGNLTVKCQFTFYKSYNIELPSPYLKKATVLSNMSILEDYENLFNSAKFSDVTLLVGNKKFSAHKNILSIRSPVFFSMFEHDMFDNKKNIVEIADIKPEIMVEILRFIYTSKVQNIKDSTVNLIAAADKYQIESLKHMCEEVFIEKLDLDNLEEILKIVDKYETCQRLRNAVLKFFSFNGKEIASWENFDRVMKTLSQTLMLEITKATMLES